MSPYHRSMAPTWWLADRAYLLFMLRELTSVFIAAYLMLFLLMLRKLALGPDAYAAYLRFLATPGMLAFHVLALAAALLHSVTWLNLTPMAMRVQLGEKRVPPALVVGVNYAAWIALSLAIAAIVLWR
jgi:fumarate reductase subunit C